MFNANTESVSYSTGERCAKKQLSLNKALERVKTRLAYYAANTVGNDFPDWNNWHDLQDRIEDRLQDNYSAYSAWHFAKYGYMIHHVN
jgi:hypothetical protein